MTKAEILDKIRGMEAELNFLASILIPKKNRRKSVRKPSNDSIQEFIDNLQKRKSK